MYIGVDVSKDKLDYFIPAANHGRPPVTGQVANDASGARKIRDLARKHSAAVCCEPTAGYEDLLVEAMLAPGVAVAFAEGYRVRRFAEACGQFSKNDLLDAAMIARFAATIGPRALTPRDSATRKARSLWRFRATVMQARMLLAAAAGTGPSRPDPRWVRETVERFKEKERRLLAECVAVLRTSPESSRLYDRMLLVGGVGPATAVAVLTELPEIAGLSPAAAAKLAGLAPAERQSGKTERRRLIRGGRERLRSALYMAAVAFLRSNRILRAYYDTKIEEGHGAKWALVPVMRKLLHLLCRIARDPGFIPAEDARKRAKAVVA